MAETLGRLATSLGEKTDYDAASQCSRCGYCEQACPTYVTTGREAFSPRGRNQLFRMSLEGKLAGKEQAARAFDTCLLCGACSSACYAHVPTADLVLEGRRALGRSLHPLARAALSLLARRPAVFAALLRRANLLARLGAARVAGALGVFRLLGLRSLERAQAHAPRPPLVFLGDRLSAGRLEKNAARAKWLYFAACGTNYLYPEVGLAAISVLERILGPGAFLGTGCCGLVMNNYGELALARERARAVIGAYEASAQVRDLPLIADCSSCVAHLKSYPQLFLDDADWKPRAEAFSRRVRDFIEVAEIHEKIRIDTPIAYHDACRARHGQGLIEEPRTALRSAGYEVCEIPEAGWCCGGAGAYAFTEPELSEEILKRKIGNIASTGAKLVATSSTSCLAQLAHGLKNYYPECKVRHVAELVSESLKPPKNG